MGKYLEIEAIHEASHCIVFKKFSVEFEKIILRKSVSKNEKGELLILHSYTESKDFDKATNEVKRIILLAGTVGQVLFGVKNATEFRRKRRNFRLPQRQQTISERIIDNLKHQNFDDFMRYSLLTDDNVSFESEIAFTVDIVEANWENIIKIADNLQLKKNLSSKDIEVLLSNNN